MKKIMIWMMVALLATSFVSCSKKTSAETGSSTKEVVVAKSTTPSNEVVVGIPGEYGDLSPFGGNSQGRSYVKYTLWETLAVFNEFGQTWDKMDWVMAKDITVVDDFTTDIEIYDYIYDTNGNQIKASDVVWSYEQAVACGKFPKVSSNLKFIEALGEYKVRMVLNGDGLGDLEYMLSYVAIASKASYEASSDKMANHPVTTGPYKVTESVPGSRLVLVKNDNYWQKDESKKAYTSAQPVDKITYNVIKETAQMAIALETGAIDIATSVASSEIDRFMDSTGKGKNGYLVNNTYGGQAVCLDFNCDPQSPLSNQLLRQAVSYAIDREGIVSAALQGKGDTIGTPGTRASSDYNTAWDDIDYPYNPEKAKELLKKAGYKEGQLKLRIMTEQNAEQPVVAQLIQAYLSEVGIEVEVLTYDNALFSQYRYQPDQFDMMIGIMGTSGYVVGAWDLQFNSTGTLSGGAAACFAKDSKLQELLELAKGKNTHSVETVEAFASYQREMDYGLGLYVKSSYSVANNKVSAIVCHPFGHLITNACTFVK